MKDNSGWKWAVILVIALALIGGIYMVVNNYTTLSIQGKQSAIVYNGEFDDVALPEDAVGTDLALNTSYAESSDDKFTATFKTSTDLNGSKDTQYLAFQLVIDGDLEAMKVNGKLASTIETSELTIKSAYILSDEEGVFVDDSTGALYVAEVESSLDEFEINTNALRDGKYVVVVAIKPLTTSGIAVDENIMDIEFDATTDGDVDEGTVSILNY